MNDEKGWRFPPTHGGRIDGFNDPGIAHFNGAPLSSLARETIQNSLDARGRLGEPVHVDFELMNLSSNDLGRDELSKAIASCKEEAGLDDDAKAALTVAEKIIDKDNVPSLRVSDRNTIGLRGDHWRALVKMQGVSHKENVGAGGSHGIGKYAPFAVSALRTVFYWTCYQEDGKQVEQFQGKSVLMSHESEEGETQGTGFYGIKEGCRELTGVDIPDPFRLLREQKPVHGTSLVIAGFNETKDWRRRITSSVVENYFYAIDNGTLTVLIEPDGDDELFEIDQASLGNWFTKLLEEGEDTGEDQDGSALKQAQAFWELSDGDEPPVEKQDKELGHCRLWIRVEEGLPSVVGFVRGTGMLVTTQQPGLLRFTGFRDFAALCVFEDPRGNELLRRMENPQHDRFEPDRLPEGEREQGKRALKRITDWIRGEIRKRALPTETGKPTMLSELATYLPDSQPDEPFDDDAHADDDEPENREPGFGERVKLQLKPIRRRTPPSLPIDDGSSEEGDGDGEDTGTEGGGGEGENGGGGNGGGAGEGDGQGGTGIRGGGQVRVKEVGISRVRILSIEGRENCYRISFRADDNGVARLELGEAGDSSTIPRDDIRAVADDASLDRVQLIKGERKHLDVTADAPIGNRAWRIRAVLSEDGHQ